MADSDAFQDFTPGTACPRNALSSQGTIEPKQLNRATLHQIDAKSTRKNEALPPLPKGRGFRAK